MSERYTLTVNGHAHHIDDAWLGESLLHVLRERVGLPGSKAGCEQGECGSCSVLVDGVLLCSCLILAAGAADTEITTIEGLSGPDDPMTTVQAAFVTEGGVQCGFCTPGLVMAVHDLLDRIPDPTELQIREAVSGNLCRCTGYGRILEAVKTASRR